MKLNLTKYAFGITAEKFLKFLVMQQGIETNLEKIKAILSMKHPNSKKKVKQLNGRVVTLSRFKVDGKISILL